NFSDRAIPHRNAYSFSDYTDTFCWVFLSALLVKNWAGLDMPSIPCKTMECTNNQHHFRTDVVDMALPVDDSTGP
ncbi:hypothetical protein, partial [Methanosarcina horonobensis]|uniref:hypothetical protein n=1 Tax=Methanosarcina horonobensis TaxID=418008 RepID=UPI000B1C3DF1